MKWRDGLHCNRITSPRVKAFAKGGKIATRHWLDARSLLGFFWRYGIKLEFNPAQYVDVTVGRQSIGSSRA
jgi:hypothetical protein